MLCGDDHCRGLNFNHEISGDDNVTSGTSMFGKICLITGATSGIGQVTAQALAHQGATVIMVGRDATRSAAAVDRIIKETGNQSVHGLLADLSSQAQIVQLAQDFLTHFDRLDVLVNNAGAIFMTRQLSPDGIEMTFALNHLAYFQLTHLLLDTLKATPSARIVNIASAAHRRGHLNWDNLQGEKRYSGWGAYCQSKLANILFTYTLAARLDGTGVTANVLHPGFVATNFSKNNTGIAAGFIKAAMRVVALTPEQGAETMIHLASSPEVATITGQYFVKKHAVDSSKETYDAATATRLWHLSEQMLGIA